MYLTRGSIQSHSIQLMCSFILLTMFSTSIFISAAPSQKIPQKIKTKQEFEYALETLLNSYYDEMLEKQNDVLQSARRQDHAHGLNSRSVFEKREHVTNGGDERFESSTHHLLKKTEANINEDDGSNSNIYDQMLSDQPVVDDTQGNGKATSEEVIKTRDKLRKENWVEYLKSQLLNQIGRTNSTISKPLQDPPLNDINITEIMPKILKGASLDDDQITEKIRSFYPSCETPQNQDTQEIWRDEDMMNLYFDFDYNSDNKNSNIATATLRLYRLSHNGTNDFNTKKDDCENLDSVEEDKLLRVSVYWYTKYQKKRRVKRRLSDSKVVSETSQWVELSVKPATKAWNKAGAKNLGLGILVEDQEGKTLKADLYFKGASCMVGVSTPKPIPTIVRDASHGQPKLYGIDSILPRNSTSTIYSDSHLLPTVDICYLEFPENTDISNYNSARINACNLRKIHEENQRLAERERVERLATLQFPNSRHIRHQRQHRQTILNNNKNFENENERMSDFESNLRSSINNKQIIFTREELEEFQRGLNR